METTVAEVIEAARDAHAAFAAHRAPSPALIGYLGRYIRRLATTIVDERPAAVVQTFDIDPATHDFDAGQALPSSSDEPPAKDVLRVTGGSVYDASGCRIGDLEVVSFPGQEVRLRWAAALVDNGRIRLLGGSTSWGGVARVEVRYFPEPTLPTKAADIVDLPGSPRDVLAACAAVFLAGRAGASVPAADRAQLGEEKREAEASYLDDVCRRRVASVAQIREVW